MDEIIEYLSNSTGSNAEKENLWACILEKYVDVDMALDDLKEAYQAQSEVISTLDSRIKALEDN